ncbi:MAG: hypothetical protein ABI614_20690 [Planctomycetota bacterium]
MPDTVQRQTLHLAAFFVAFHLTLLGAFAAWGSYRVQHIAAEAKLPPLRETPLEVRPLYDYDVVVSDEQLARILGRLQLPFEGAATKLNHVDHAMRFWTVAAAPSAEQFMSGEQMRTLLTDTRRFREVYGNDEPTLLIDRAAGVAVRVQEGNATSSHVDHTLACLAEVGTPLAFPVASPTRLTTFRALVEQSLRDFSLNQVEYEWSGLTYALFLPPQTTWRTREGQEMNFDRLADRMMREALPNGVCFANHRLYTLVVFLRIDDQMPILSAATRAQILEYLTLATIRLEQHQHPDGFWNADWPDRTPDSTAPTVTTGDRLADRILATGHALEWWAMAPEEVHPGRATLAAAGQWLVKTIDSMTEEEIRQNYTYLSHAGRALCIWRGRWPHGEIPMTNDQ